MTAMFLWWLIKRGWEKGNEAAGFGWSEVFK